MKINLDERTPIVEQCETAGIILVPDKKDKDKRVEQKVPCRKIDGEFCSVYLFPSRKWTRGCPMADRVALEATEKMINPLKASKRGGK